MIWQRTINASYIPFFEATLVDPNIGDRFQLDGLSLDIGVRVRENGGQSQMTQKHGDQGTDWDLHFGLIFWVGALRIGLAVGFGY